MSEENEPIEDDVTGAGQPHRHGSMRFQDAENSTPREPTLAEQRARQKAAEERERAAAEEEAAQEALRAREPRRKLLITSGFMVGLAGFIASWYVVAAPDEVTAVCVDEDGTVVDDDYCDDDYASTHGGHHSGGVVFLPSSSDDDGYRQYRYNYGGSGRVGSKVQGGSYNRPSNASISTRSGTTVQRGGFGISGGSFGKGGGS